MGSTLLDVFSVPEPYCLVELALAGSRSSGLDARALSGPGCSVSACRCWPVAWWPVAHRGMILDEGG